MLIFSLVAAAPLPSGKPQLPEGLQKWLHDERVAVQESVNLDGRAPIQPDMSRAEMQTLIAKPLRLADTTPDRKTGPRGWHSLWQMDANAADAAAPAAGAVPMVPMVSQFPPQRLADGSEAPPTPDEHRTSWGPAHAEHKWALQHHDGNISMLAAESLRATAPGMGVCVSEAA